MESFRKQFSTGLRHSSPHPTFTPQESSLVVAILSAGTFVGAICAAPTGDRLGRRVSLMISVAIFAFGCILQTIASQIPMMVAGR